MYGLDLKSTLLQSGGAVSSTGSNNARTRRMSASFSQTFRSSGNVASGPAWSGDSEHQESEKGQDEIASGV